MRRRGDEETRRQGDKETRRRGEEETRRRRKEEKKRRGVGVPCRGGEPVSQGEPMGVKER